MDKVVHYCRRWGIYDEYTGALTAGAGAATATGAAGATAFN